MIEALFLVLAASGAQAADPLAPARQGKIQCINPNAEKKTCMGFASYTVRADGTYDATATIMIAPAPAIAMETRSTGKVEGDQVCAVVRREDYTAATFTVDGKPADAATSEAIKGQILAAVASMEGKNACSRDKAEGNVMLAEMTLDGAARPDLNQRYIWVSPTDGYKLGM